MLELEQIAKASIPRALEKAERYRLLNEPRQAIPGTPPGTFISFQIQRAAARERSRGYLGLLFAVLVGQAGTLIAPHAGRRQHAKRGPENGGSKAIGVGSPAIR